MFEKSSNLILPRASDGSGGNLESRTFAVVLQCTTVSVWLITAQGAEPTCAKALPNNCTKPFGLFPAAIQSEAAVAKGAPSSNGMPKPTPISSKSLTPMSKNSRGPVASTRMGTGNLMMSRSGADRTSPTCTTSGGDTSSRRASMASERLHSSSIVEMTLMLEHSGELLPESSSASSNSSCGMEPMKLSTCARDTTSTNPDPRATSTRSAGTAGSATTAALLSVKFGGRTLLRSTRDMEPFAWPFHQMPESTGFLYWMTSKCSVPSAKTHLPDSKSMTSKKAETSSKKTIATEHWTCDQPRR
mmetsp:Transcript_60518/g.174588  ORF Transcript_60518/g.174588 Transcript_60518/m.174588 type:complete len:302 (-) Transcript_60518:515-1420(-)